MLPKIKNAIIFVSIALVLILAYVFLIKKTPEGENLVSFSGSQNNVVSNTSSSLDKDFLPLLLSVKNIKLDDSIFSDPAFIFLVDSSIVLTPDGNEGRSNPFALFGVEDEDDINIDLDLDLDLDLDIDNDNILDGSFFEVN